MRWQLCITGHNQPNNYANVVLVVAGSYLDNAGRGDRRNTGTCVNIIQDLGDKIGQADTGEMFTDDDNLGYVRQSPGCRDTHDIFSSNSKVFPPGYNK